MRVLRNTRIPGHWANFLRNKDNKAEWFSYLASIIVDLAQDDKQVKSTNDPSVIANTCLTEDKLMPCLHEEADTRILLQVPHVAQLGLKTVMTRTVDTYVLVLAIGMWPY